MPRRRFRSETSGFESSPRAVIACRSRKNERRGWWFHAITTKNSGRLNLNARSDTLRGTCSPSCAPSFSSLRQALRTRADLHAEILALRHHHRCARQPAGGTPKAGLPGVWVDTQCGYVLAMTTASAPDASTAFAITPILPITGESFTHSGRFAACFAAETTSAASTGSVPYSAPPCFTLGQEMFSS